VGKGKINKKQKLRDEIATMELQMEVKTENQRKILKKNLEDKQIQLLQLDTYQPSQGTPKCRQAAADLINHYYPLLNAEPRQCCIANGATQCLSLLTQVFVEPGVAVAAFSPFFPPYKKVVEAFGGTWISIPTLENCRPSLEALEETLSQNSNISLLILNDPCNPSGIKLTRDELIGIGKILAKPEYQGIVIISDETYHDLIYSDEKDLFLSVVDLSSFKSRTCIVLSLAKGLAGCPGLRFGVAYTPDMVINGKKEQIGTKLGTLMLDSTCSVSSSVQYVGQKILKAKIGKGKTSWINIHKEWEQKIYNIYENAIKVGVSVFSKESKFPLIVNPEGAFFGIISGKNLLGKRVPHTVTLLDGRTVTDLVAKVGTLFTTDVQIANFLLYAAEVVTVPVSGFDFDETCGLLRISFAVSEEGLKEAARRLINAADQVI